MKIFISKILVALLIFSISLSAESDKEASLRSGVVLSNFEMKHGSSSVSKMKTGELYKFKWSVISYFKPSSIINIKFPGDSSYTRIPSQKRTKGLEKYHIGSEYSYEYHFEATFGVPVSSKAGKAKVGFYIENDDTYGSSRRMYALITRSVNITDLYSSAAKQFNIPIIKQGSTAIKFPGTTITSRYSNSTYAKSQNGFYANSHGQDLRGQCTWYAYGRIVELSSAGKLPSSAKNNLRNSQLWNGYGRDGGNWPAKLFGSSYWFDTASQALPYNKRKAGLLVSWKGTGSGNLKPGHIAFIEEVNADKSKYRVSEFNYGVTLGYGSVWLPFEGNDQRAYGSYPRFVDPSNKNFFK